MSAFLQIPDNERRRIYRDVSNKLGLPPQAIEKDVWVTLMLRMVFSSKHAEHFIFKGGTSLSKAFNLIQRFSEDIDLGIDRKYLGFNDVLTNADVRKLRRACHAYVSNELPVILENRLTEYGVDPDSYEMIVENTKISDQDQETIQINFKSLFEGTSYLANNIKIEVSARSLIEPNQKILVQSWIDQQYPSTPFVETPFELIATDPKKTFLEKLLLLHEEFQKPQDKIRHLRMSRHFYDLSQILDSEFGPAALADGELFKNIIAHRKVLTPIKNIDYDALDLQMLNILPPPSHLENYRADYKEMQNSMIHGDTKEFGILLNEIIEKLK